MGTQDYLELFLTEASQYLTGARTQLKSLKKGDPAAGLEELFRHAHSLKGMAACMGFQGLVDFSHALEGVLAGLRDHPDRLEDSTRRLLDAGFREIGSLIEAIESGTPDPRADRALVRKIAELTAASSNGRRRGGKPASEPVVREILVEMSPSTPHPPARALVIRKAVASLGELLEAATREEDLSPDHPTGPLRFVLSSPLPGSRIRQALRRLADVRSVRIRKRADGVPRLRRPPSGTAPDPVARSIRVGTDQLDRLLETGSEIIIHQERLEMNTRWARDDPGRQSLERLRTAAQRLNREILAMRLVPFEGMADLLNRTVGQVAAKKKKKIRFEITGREVRMDRSILERLQDPLLHLIRNCVDHGIETLRGRKAAGKDPEGRLQLSVTRQGQELCVELRDDGRGIDPEKVKRRARQGGWIGDSQLRRMTEAEVLQLVTLPGFSTKVSADEISGRGIGMDVVAARIRSMGGNLEIDSTPGRGTGFRLRIPLTVAMMDGLLIGGAGGWFALPLHQVEATLEFDADDLVTRGERTHLRVGDESFRFLSLDRALGVEPSGPARTSSLALVLRAGEKRFCLQVDTIQGRRELVLRPLKSPLDAVPEFSGAAVLEDGVIALVLNPPTLLVTGAA